MVWWWGGQVPINSLTVACVEGKWEGGKTKGKREGKSNSSPIFPSFLCPFWHLSSNLHLMVTRSEAGEKPAVYLWVRRGARNPNLQVFITHASHVCSQHSFGPPLWMNGMHIMQFDQTRLDLSTTHNLITHVLTICHIKLTQRTALEQKRFDLLTFLPTLHNLWLYY